jgi:hypothetical protein
MAGNPETRWELLNIAMLHFQQYLNSKEDRFSVSIVDLLHVSNFKGGNASITEPLETLDDKLRLYETKLRAINHAFAGKSLRDLDCQETIMLIAMCDDVSSLATNKESKIKGIDPSYSSALLFACFPDLIPVLDRRILNGANIEVTYNSQKQVKNIENHYGDLIIVCQLELINRPLLSLRELDKEYFVKEL